MPDTPALARRGLLAAAAALAARPAFAARPAPAPPAAPQAVQPIRIMAGELGGTFAQIGSDLSVAVAAPDVRVIAELSHGSLDNLQGLIQLRGVDLGLVAADTLAWAKQHNVVPSLNRIQYITKLYDNEVHVLAKDAANRTLTDLRGKKVNIDVPGSGTALTCGRLFPMLGVQAEFLQNPPAKALEQLRHGEIDALVYCIGKPGDLFRRLPADAGLHMVEVPYADAVQQDYLPGSFSHADYPGLIPEGGADVPTIAVGVVLACFGWDPGTDRYRTLARFVELFLRNFPQLREPPFHPKWRDVDVRATVPGWVRFAPVEALLAAASTPAAPANDLGFDAFLKAVGRANPSLGERQELMQIYRNLRR